MSRTIPTDERLGASRSALQAVSHTGDRAVAHMAQMNGSEACALGSRTLQQVLSEVSEPVLQRQVLAPCLAAMQADEQVCQGHRPLLVAAAGSWSQQPLLARASASHPVWATTI